MKVGHLHPMGSKRTSRCFAEALARYEAIREQVYRELKIKHTQRAVSNKILGRDDNRVELLFYQDSGEDAYDVFASSSTGCDFASSTCSSEPSVHHAGRKKRVAASKYLDLEAECSREEDEEDMDEDLDGMIDDSCDSGIDLGKFIRERNEINEMALKDLRRRFVKPGRRVVRSSEALQAVQSDSSVEFPEIWEMEYCIEDPSQDSLGRKSLNPVEERRAFLEDEQLFNNDPHALERLSRKDERCTGFFEQENLG